MTALSQISGQIQLILIPKKDGAVIFANLYEILKRFMKNLVGTRGMK